jgi:hypothetical protein
VALAGQNSWRMGRTRSHRGSGTSQIVPSGLRLPACFRLGFGRVAGHGLALQGETPFLLTCANAMP